VRTHIAYLLTGFGRTQQAGYVFVGLPIHDVWGRPGTHHRPDVCYISVAKLPTLTDDDFVRVVPDLVVEVVSAEDTVGDVEGRVFDYTMAGVKAVWLVYPAIKMCRVQYPDGTGRMLNITGTLDGGQALPGFTCPVVDLFPKT
jgi:Uma2 family endonuclease